MAVVDRRADGSERVKYDYDGYLAYIRKGQLSNYPNYAADSHWHDDLEFISVLSGCMDYCVNGELVHLAEGQGILVNTRQLHYGFSAAQQECTFYCVLLHPMLLCTSQQIDRELVSPILSGSAYVLLDGSTPWQGELLGCIGQIYQHKDRPNAPLYIQQAFYRIWILLSENAMHTEKTKKQDRNLAVLKDMLAFVQKNYGSKVSLDDIARAGGVSKSTCLSIFKKYLRETPADYLISYRLKRAKKLLRSSDLPVTEIALSVGFCGASYFAETFRKHTGCSPRDYRNAKITGIRFR